jgi:HAD superfamily hydrolase (TIGR01509 family)
VGRIKVDPYNYALSLFIRQSMDCFCSFIFDLDGVLVNTSGAHARAYADLWQRIGINGPDYEGIAGRKTEEVLRQFCGELHPSEDKVLKWIRFKQERARDYIMSEDLLYDDTIFTLKTLWERAFLLALATGSSHATTSLILERYNLAHYFNAVITADDALKGKPAPDMYLEAIKRTKMNPAETLIVEDSQSGLISALDSGAFVASIRTGIRLEHKRFIGSYENLRSLLAEFEK